MDIIRYELKYCERCGTLKLRPVTSSNTYCDPCERLLARFAFSRNPGAGKPKTIAPSATVGMIAGIPLAVMNNQLAGRVR